MDKLVIIDGNSLINRAFFGIRNLSTKDGQATNAVYGFLNIMHNIIEKMKPSHLAVAFDVKAPTFRKRIYADYKAQRKAADPNLISQFPILKDILFKLGVKCLSIEGFEADDIIGTVVNAFQGKSYIVTSDGDSYQLVSDKTSILVTKIGFSEVIEIDKEYMLANYNLQPYQIIDKKALMGDKSDNIPGAPGVGEVKASKLLAQFNTVENMYMNIEQLEDPKLKQILIENEELVRLSYKLATIVTNVPIDLSFDDYKFNGFSKDALELLYKYELNKIIKQYFSINSKEFAGIEDKNNRLESSNTISNIEEIFIKEIFEIKNLISSNELYLYLDDKKVHLCINDNKEYIIKYPEGLFGEGITQDFIFDYLKVYFENPFKKVITFNVKKLMHILDQYDIKFNASYDDVQIAQYILDSNKDNSDLLNLYGKNVNHLAHVIKELNVKYKKEMEDANSYSLYSSIEIPLAKVLFDMEKTGFRVDKQAVLLMERSFDDNLKNLSNKIYELSGQVFNINSPKQLAKVLYEDLKLPHGKKNRTGYSTNIEELTKLVEESEIIEVIIKYREIQKLQSTYIKPMLSLLDSNSRIHTEFRQTFVATGRLSSIEPNLQNIPIKKGEGRELRRLFIASNGCVLLNADYSQIELRLMAHFSRDKNLIDAFKKGKDIHAATAANLLGKNIDDVTSQERSNAKAVNFGVVYGISAFGLSNDTGLKVNEAKEFINDYFIKYPSIKSYLDQNINFAKNNGYITSIMGRRRYIPQLNDSKKAIKEFGERIAMNTPLQASASDLIKRAMVDIYSELNKRKLKAKLILQVHDELIIDCPVDEKVEVAKILNEAMVKAYPLVVPLVADVNVGESWYDSKA